MVSLIWNSNTRAKETSSLVMDDFGLDQYSQWHYGGTTENNGHTLKFTPKQDVDIKSKFVRIKCIN